MKDLARRVHPTWRLVAGMVLAQLPGAAIGFWLAPTNDWFMNCWYGAAFALPFGFMAGLFWHRRVAGDALADFRWHILAYGVFSLALPTAGVLTYDLWANATAV